MNFLIQRSPLRDLHDKVAAGERISDADALRLFESKDLNALGAIADLVRQRKAGNRASYIINRYINYSNYCILSCQFCSFARKKRDADGFQHSVEEIVQKAREALRHGHHGSAHRRRTASVAARSPITPACCGRCGHLIRACNSNASPPSKFCISPGSPKNPSPRRCGTQGGGARFPHRRRRGDFPQGSPLRHRPRQGIRRGIPGCPPHLAPNGRAQHLHHALRPRRVPGRPRGPSAPVARVAGRNARLHRASFPSPTSRKTTASPSTTPPTGFEPCAPSPSAGFTSITSTTSPPTGSGWDCKLAQVALSYGADDLHGTIIEEHIFHMAGATSPQLQTEAALVKAIREAGRTPVQRNTFYEPIKILEPPPAHGRLRFAGGKIARARKKFRVGVKQLADARNQALLDFRRWWPLSGEALSMSKALK